jgi:hypothetical protein
VTDRVVELVRLPDGVQAALLAGRLEAEGIEANCASGRGAGHAIFVFSSDYERALTCARDWGYLG